MRKFRSKKQWQILLADQQASGKSVAEFCQDKKIHPNLFYKKKRDYKSGRFVQLPVKPFKSGSKIIIRIQNIIIEPAPGYDKSELSQIITTILEVVNANIQ